MEPAESLQRANPRSGRGGAGKRSRKTIASIGSKRHYNRRPRHDSQSEPQPLHFLYGKRRGGKSAQGRSPGARGKENKRECKRQSSCENDRASGRRLFRQFRLLLRMPRQSCGANALECPRLRKNAVHRWRNQRVQRPRANSQSAFAVLGVRLQQSRLQNTVEEILLRGRNAGRKIPVLRRVARRVQDANAGKKERVRGARMKA